LRSEDTPYFGKPEDEEVLALSIVVENSYFEESSDEVSLVGREDQSGVTCHVKLPVLTHAHATL